jgi:hypothetical protein
MRIAKFLLAMLLITGSFLVGNLWAQRGADGVMDPRTGQLTPYGDPLGPVLTGLDVGLQRISAPLDSQGRVPVRWMVKINGEWREAIIPTRIVR